MKPLEMLVLFIFLEHTFHSINPTEGLSKDNDVLGVDQQDDKSCKHLPRLVEPTAEKPGPLDRQFQVGKGRGHTTVLMNPYHKTCCCFWQVHPSPIKTTQRISQNHKSTKRR